MAKDKVLYLACILAGTDGQDAQESLWLYLRRMTETVAPAWSLPYTHVWGCSETLLNCARAMVLNAVVSAPSP